MSSEPTPVRTGRRPGPTQTREAIVQAAREQFAELGYDRTTIRGVARAAGVDPALVLRFHGSKDDLFRSVMALPPEVAGAIAQLADGPRESVGRRLAEIVVGLMESPATRPVLLGRIRSAAAHPVAAALVRETVARDLGALARAVSADEPETRAVLVGSHLVGVAIARYAVAVEPLSSLPAGRLVDLLAPTFQRFLTEPLD